MPAPLSRAGTVLQHASMEPEPMCQPWGSKRTAACGGEYVLAIKDNQPTLHAKAQVLLEEAVKTDGRGLILDCFEELDADNGCLERRKVWITPEIEHLRPAAQEFEGLAGVETVREIERRVSREHRYYLFSHQEASAELIAGCIRGHWSM